MRNTQQMAAKTVVTCTTMLWAALCERVISSDQHPPTNPAAQRAQLQHLAGGLPMGLADYWVFPLHSL
jgi:hypothetical protein